jgi:hypothetical protein
MQDFVANSENIESAELCELPELGGPANGGASRNSRGEFKFHRQPSNRNSRRRNFSTAASAAVIDNASAASSCPVCSPSRGLPAGHHHAADRSSSVTAINSATGSRSSGALLGQTTTFGASGLLEQRLVQTLNKITDTISLNELRIQERERKDAIRIEWQQVSQVL